MLKIRATLAVIGAVSIATAASANPSDDTQIVLLGTLGGPVADAHRSEPATMLIVNGQPYLIDAGEGTARQLAAIGSSPSAIRTIFITHHHLDHTAGLEPLMALSWIGTGLRGPKLPPVQIYGPPATVALTKTALSYIAQSERIFKAGIPSLPDAESMFAAHDINKGGQFFQDANIKVTAVENSHFGTASHMPNGVKDLSFSYRFDTPSGAVVITGDTGPSENLNELSKGADVLVSEIYLRSENTESQKTAVAKQLADHLEHEHLSPEEVGKLATRSGAKTVILTHIVTPPGRDATEQLESSVKKWFSGRVIVGKDLLKYDLKSGQVD